MLLYQPESGYCYNSDSLFLYDFINSFSPKGKVLDVGAGCGVVGLLVARDNPKVELYGVELQESFQEYITHNARVNKIKYTLYKQDFLSLDLDIKYDYIVSNPPFYHDGAKKSQNEMLYYARYNIHLPLDAFFKKVSQLLKPKAHFIFCYDASQLFDICVALQNVKLRIVDIRFVHPKKEKDATLVMIHARNGSRSMVKTHKPLIVFDGNEFTQEVTQIYKKSKTQSIKCQL